MKAGLLITTVLLAGSMASAQANPPTPQAAPAAKPSQTPAATAPSQAGTSSPAPATAGHRMLQAKTQDEMKAYQDAAAMTDPAQLVTAADAFAVKFPTSDLRAALYIRAMNEYAQQNNAEKIVEVGRKAIAADPINPVPLVQVASALAESTRDTDIDREARLNEAAKDAQAAIDNIDAGLIVPPNTPPDRLAAAKASIATMSYDTLGMVAMNKKDYAGAEQNFTKAVDASKASPEAVVYLRLSVAQDQQKKYPQALESANKAVQYAPEGSAAQNLAKQQQVRLQKLIAAGSPAGGTRGDPGCYSLTGYEHTGYTAATAGVADNTAQVIGLWVAHDVR